MAQTVSVSEVDYLEADKPVRGQNYACVSFVSPEAVLKDKHLFLLGRFLRSTGREVGRMLDNLAAKYPADKELLATVRQNHDYLFEDARVADQYRYYLENCATDDEKEFHEQKNFQTTMRGFKIRGTYDTLREAEVRSEVLRRSGDKHSIFVCQVGMWCPWDPNPNDISETHYAEDQLNTLMKAYKDSATLRDEEYQKRKEHALKSKGVEEVLESEDAWLARKQDELRTGVVKDADGTAEAPKVELVREEGEAAAAAAAAAAVAEQQSVYAGDAIQSIKI